MVTSRSGSGNGSGRRSTAWTTAKMAALAARHRARVARVVAVKPRSRSSERTAWRRSRNNWSHESSGGGTCRRDGGGGDAVPPCDMMARRGRACPPLRLGHGPGTPAPHPLPLPALRRRLPRPGQRRLRRPRHEPRPRLQRRGLRPGLGHLLRLVHAARGAQQPDAGPGRGRAVDRPDHADLGPGLLGDGVRARPPRSTCCASCSAPPRPGSSPASSTTSPSGSRPASGPGRWRSS